MIYNAEVRIDKVDNGFLVVLSRWDTEKEIWRSTSTKIFKQEDVAFSYAKKELGKELSEAELVGNINK